LPELRILAVDSDASALRVIAGVLRRSGYEVAVSGDPCAAVRLVLNGLHPDLLVTGFVFAGTNGVAMAQEIRCYAPGLPVLIVTAGAENLPPNIARHGFSVLPKPFLPRDLTGAVAAALAGSRLGTHLAGSGTPPALPAAG
jgi:DNA-binding NtrC family response regulator